ncbi:MAG: class I SAM-dependent methyltransferase, partial [bacterium]
MDSIRANVRSCGDTDMAAGRGSGQLDWYRFALRYVAAEAVLDVGCGLGRGLTILQSRARQAHGLDTDPRLARQDILTIPIQDVAAKSYDIVTSIDVVEHVEEPEAFVRHLARIARKGIFIATPNWTASRCQWPFHLREYTP